MIQELLGGLLRSSVHKTGSHSMCKESQFKETVENDTWTAFSLRLSFDRFRSSFCEHNKSAISYEVVDRFVRNGY